MKETLEMMRSIITGKEGKEDEKQLIINYQNNLSPNILAYMFVSNYGVITNLSKSYKYLDDEDKASFCLQELDKALITFDIEKDIKFITYFRKLYINRLRTETETILTNKRKTYLFSDDIDTINENIYFSSDNSIDNLLDDYNLTKDEKIQCKLLNSGYTIKEIAKIVGKSVPLIYQRNVNIRKKLSFIL